MGGEYIKMKKKNNKANTNSTELIKISRDNVYEIIEKDLKLIEKDMDEKNLFLISPTLKTKISNLIRTIRKTLPKKIKIINTQF